MSQQIDINEILKYIPHRYPFLLLDRVLNFELGKELTGLKNVTINEPFFQGHFPKRPVMPGVLMLEALAQASGVLAYLTTNDSPENQTSYLFGGIENARFKRIVSPGDQLVLHTELLKNRRNVWKFQGIATVDGEVAATAELTCAIQGQTS